MSNPIYRKKGNDSTIVTQVVSEESSASLQKALGEKYVELSDVKSLSEEEHLGIVRAFGQQSNNQHSCVINPLIDKGAVVNIPHGTSGLKYSQEVSSGGAKVLSIECSTGDKLGYLGTKPKFIVNRPVSPGDIISNDATGFQGGQLMIDPNSTVEPLGDGTYKVTVQLSKDNNPMAFENRAEWENQGFEVSNNFRGEFDTNASGLNAGDSSEKRIERLFRISDKQLIEIGYSDDAGVAMSYNNSKESMDAELAMKAKAMEGKRVIIGDIQGEIRKNATNFRKIYSLPAINYLLGQRALEFASNALWRQQGVDTQGHNMKRVYAAPGLVHQFVNECPNFTWNNAATFRMMLIMTSNYIFKNIKTEHRVLEITGGQDYEAMLKEVFKDEFSKNQVVLDQNAIPNPILTGKDNMHLTYHPIGISEAFLSGIGYVKFNHDTAFDLGGKNTKFLGRGNKSSLSGSGIITDAREIYDKAAKLAKMGLSNDLAMPNDYKGSNIVLLKDTGKPLVAFGWEKGRSMFGGEGSSKRFEHSNYVSVNRMAAKIVDPSAAIYMSRDI